ncbi:MAG: DUF1838 family protein [Steroidobacteraceae bacterium]
MTESTISRRNALKHSVLLGGALAGVTSGAMGLLVPTSALGASANAVSSLNLEDPVERTRVLAKIRGSIAEETVYTFCRLHLYLYLNDGNLLPMLTMQNLNAARWRPLPNGHYAGKVYEVGVYTKFDTDEVVDTWRNPVTGEDRKIWQFFGGPLSVEIGPDGIVTGPEATLKPKEMRIDVLGATVITPNHSAFSFPNPFKEDKWPKEAGGPTFFWDSHYFHAASLADVLNPDLSRVISVTQFQNMVSFHPWLGMGKTPGRTYGKGLGSKLRSLDDVPAAARAVLEQRAPEIFELDKWTKPRIDFMEYMQERAPG